MISLSEIAGSIPSAFILEFYQRGLVLDLDPPSLVRELDGYLIEK
jgi:hypothetical protein